jgi:mono/diheme cytochrome c family protein
MRSVLLAVGVVAVTVIVVAQASRGAAPAVPDVVPTRLLPVPCPNAQAVPAELQLPASVEPGDPVALEQRILGYLRTYKYRELGWCVDKAVRDTGPYVHGQYFGTHPAVRIYYSPQMIAWLRGGRRGDPADGAVIIKEQYSPTPAARYAGLHDRDLRPTDWTFMIRRASASRDGWFWGEVWTTMFANPPKTTAYQNAGFGLYCLRCHGSAEKATTFASTTNIKGFPGDPITFYVDDSWRTPLPNVAVTPNAEPRSLEREHEKNAAASEHTGRVEEALHVLPAPVQTFPAEPLDTVVAAQHGPHAFLTSDQCMGCHSAASGIPAGPLMWLTPPPFVPATPTPAAAAGPIGVNVSEYGEWRWSPMGLAGRDPVFFSQLEGEQAGIDAIPDHAIAGHDPARTRAILKQQVVDTCMRCHGVMGKRTLDADHGPDAHFQQGWVFAADPASPAFHYGGLARDGISCTVCHRIVQTPKESASLAYVLETRSTGLFSVGPPDRYHGPFENAALATAPMKESLNVKPVFSDLTKSARLCTSCHSINLPVIDAPPKVHPIVATMEHDVEQNTYVEWVNSRFQTEYAPQRGAKSCQDCHMPPSVANARLHVENPQIQTRIALVQDQTYPQADHRAPLSDITVSWREQGYRRHELLGLNAFLLQTFGQNPDVLGVRLADYMSGSITDLPDAIANVVHQATTATAKIDLATQVEQGTLVATVDVQNLTGHRFPSGVGFRRAFLELEVTKSDGTPIFRSGYTDRHGVIVDDGKPLPSEFFAHLPDGKQAYQPHYDARRPITQPGQVQIFEELVQDKAGAFTDSFVMRDHIVKDNRLLPQGWRHDGPAGIPLPQNWLVATRPVGVDGDPAYADGSGSARTVYRIALPADVDPSTLRVAATLWYQAWQPDFLKLRTTGDGPAATRLRALIRSLGTLDGTPLAGWKLKIAAASRAVDAR